MSYTLFDGELNVGGDLVVGSLGLAPASFEQHAGNLAIDGMLRADGGSIQIHSGQATIGHLDVGVGNLHLNSEASLRITDEFRLGVARFTTSENNPTIELAPGADFSVEFWEEPFDVPGLTGLNLSIEGSGEVTPESISEIEIFHWDAGPESDAAADFALGEIQIGSNGEPAHVRFKDVIGNNWAERNAMYVETLSLSPGSVLDLNRRNLYYDELILGEGAEIINQGPDCDSFGYLTPHDLTCVGPENIEHLLDELGVPAGDLNIDGVVDFSDFLVLSEHFGMQEQGYLGGDIDLDGIVAFSDFLQFSANWGATGPHRDVWGVDIESLVSAVPEPVASGPIFGGVFVAILVGFRKRRRATLVAAL